MEARCDVKTFKVWYQSLVTATINVDYCKAYDVLLIEQSVYLIVATRYAVVL